MKAKTMVYAQFRCSLKAKTMLCAWFMPNSDAQ